MRVHSASAQHVCTSLSLSLAHSVSVSKFANFLSDALSRPELDFAAGGQKINVGPRKLPNVSDVSETNLGKTLRKNESIFF